VDGEQVRLWGIDLPEKGQVCADGWKAGEQAMDYLSKTTMGKAVTCVWVDWEGRQNPPASICRVPSTSVRNAAPDLVLNAEMIRRGLAWVSTNSPLYAWLENEAKNAGRGVHGHGCKRRTAWSTSSY
jgi:endonuclease YncB( thermonuclease family)